MKIRGQIIELAVRLLVKISCVLVGYATAIALHRNAADLIGYLIFGMSTIAAFAVLRPVAYRVYPELKASDLRRAKRVSNPATLAAFSILVLLLVTFVMNVWLGVAFISVTVAGALFAAATAFWHRTPTSMR